MKKLLGLVLLSTVLFATDYSSMSLEEMLSQKGSVPELEREAFRTEMKSRMQALSPEERAEYRQKNMQKKQLKDGSGSGNMYKGSKGNRY